MHLVSLRPSIVQTPSVVHLPLRNRQIKDPLQAMGYLSEDIGSSKGLGAVFREAHRIAKRIIHWSDRFGNIQKSFRAADFLLQRKDTAYIQPLRRSFDTVDFSRFLFSHPHARTPRTLCKSCMLQRVIAPCRRIPVRPEYPLLSPVRPEKRRRDCQACRILVCFD